MIVKGLRDNVINAYTNVMHGGIHDSAFVQDTSGTNILIILLCFVDFTAIIRCFFKKLIEKSNPNV
jgi:hypothetical protein